MSVQNPVNVGSTAANSTVSVVLPTYNRKHTLGKALDSVGRQSYPIQEVVVIDDGSTDGTDVYVRKHFPHVNLIVQSNRGVSHARNQGIAIAKGSWVAFLDSDDHWHPTKIAEQMQALRALPDCGFCHCDEIWIRNGKRVNPKFKHRKYGGYIFEHCLPLCAVSPSAALIRRDIFSRYGVFDETLPACEDYDLWLRISAHEHVAFVDKLLLTKTGGHSDQLSHRYAVMDSFRLQALAKLLRSGNLSICQRDQAYAAFTQKLAIVTQGARKRDNGIWADALVDQYKDIAVLFDG